MDSAKPKALFQEFLKGVKAGKASKAAKDYIDSIAESVEKMPEPNFKIDGFVQVFKHAVESDDDKVMCLALDQISTSLSLGYLEGKKLAAPQQQLDKGAISVAAGRRVIDQVVEFVCYCTKAVGEEVQLKVCRVLVEIFTDIGRDIVSESLRLMFSSLCFIMENKASTLVESSAKKCIINVALNLLQRLDYPLEVSGNLSLESGAGSRKSFIHEISLLFLSDCSEIYLERERVAEARGWLIADIPFRTVPLSLDPNDKSYQIDYQVDLLNEKQEPCGRFGWCVLCRKTADLYCKDTRLPVCSFACKTSLIEQDMAFEKQDIELNRVPLLKQKQLVDDCLSMFKNFLKHAFNNANVVDINTQSLKIAFLEILISIIQNPPEMLLNSEDFIEFLRNEVLTNTIVNATSAYPKIMSLSLILFNNLIKNFRRHFREEIPLFIDEVVLKMLESVNNKPETKLYIIRFLSNIVENSKILLEFFLNFDCNPKSTPLVEKIIVTLSRISQGKFEKKEFAVTVQKEQEKEIRKSATDCLLRLVSNLETFIQRYRERGQRVLSESMVDQMNENEKTTFTDLQKIFDTIKTNTTVMEAITQFNLKVKSGLEKFREMGIYSNEEQFSELADFIFKYTDKFSKEKLGDFLSDEAEFNQNVLKYYLKHFNFEKIFIPDAFRYFLQFLDLPGESQKIERICYKFAYQYLEDNHDLMSDDAACIFTFLMVMCHTQLYNVNIEDKNKMSQQTFCSMASRCESTREPLSADFCTRVYQNLAAKPLAVHWAQKRRDFLNEALAANAKKKEELCKTENAKILEELDSKMDSIKEEKQKAAKKGAQAPEIRPYIKFSNMNLVKPFLSSIWKELFAFFSILIEKLPDDSDFSEVVKCSIRMMMLADLFDMDDERDAFIQVFVQFSGLDLIENRELTAKNLYFIKTLINLAESYPNHLHKGWKIILDTVTRIDYYRDLGAGANKKARLEKAESQAKHKGKKDIESINYLNVSNLLPSTSSMAETIFMNTAKLIDQRSLVDLFTSLCRIAEEKIGGRDSSEIFNKIFMCLVINFDRSIEDLLELLETSIAKTYIKIITDLEAGLHPNKNDLIIAVEISLKQILEKFFEHRDIIAKQYQPRLLQPLLLLVGQTSCCFEFICEYSAQTGLRKKKIIGQGWITIFKIVGVCLQRQRPDRLDYIVNVSHQLLSGFSENLEDNLEFVFEDLGAVQNIVVLLLFVSNKKVAELANKIMRKLNSILSRVLGFCVQSEGEADFIDPAKLKHLSQVALRHALPEELVSITMVPLVTLLFSFEGKEPKDLVIGVELGIEILKGFCSELKRDGWKSVFTSVLDPFIDSSLEHKRADPKDSQIIKLMKNTLKEFYFTINEAKDKDVILDYMGFLHKKMSSRDKNFVEIFSETVVDIMQHKPFPEIIKSMIDIVCNTISSVLPAVLLNNNLSEFIEAKGLRATTTTQAFPEVFELDIDSGLVQTNCFTLLEMIKLVSHIVQELHSTVEAADQSRLMSKIEECRELCNSFNSDILLRYLLWKSGYNSKNPQLPSLYKIEKTSTEILLTHKFKLIQLAADDAEKKQAIQAYLQNVSRLVANYLTRYDSSLSYLNQPADQAELRDPTIIENFNWTNWHLNSVILPSLVQLDQVLLASQELLAPLKAEIKEFLIIHGEYLASPNLEQLLKAKFIKSEAHIKQIVAEKPNIDLELQIRDLFPKLLSSVLSFT